MEPLHTSETYSIQAYVWSTLHMYGNVPLIHPCVELAAGGVRKAGGDDSECLPFQMFYRQMR